MLKVFRSVPIQLGEFSVIPESEIAPNVQILRVGKFIHPEYGEFSISQTDLQNMVRNFQEKVRGTDIAIDFAHESEKEAAGWIQAIFLNEDQTELWGTVKWTPIGRQALVDREYRYLSADFTYNYLHNEDLKEYGPTLFGAGLTNRPFVKNMAPVIELTEGKGKKMDEKDKLIAELKKQIEELKAGGGKMEVELADMKKQLDDYVCAAKKSAAEKKMSEMKADFDLLLTEGKACEAQREHFMSGDAIAYAKAAQPVKLSEVGSAAPAKAEITKENVQEEISKLAKKLAEEKKIGLAEAIGQVLHANKDLNEKYIESTKL